MSSRLRIAACHPQPELIGAILAQPLGPRPELVPCIIWNGGTSRGRPMCRIPPHTPGHPVSLFFDPRPDRINRVCQTQLCVNPYHFVCLPRSPTLLQHPLVFQAEEQIENFDTLDQAYEGINIPRQFVLAAWRNHRQLGMRAHP